MRLFSKISLVCCGVILLIGCATPKKTTGPTAAEKKYSEDLSMWRPKVDPVQDQITAEQTDRKQPPYVEPKFAINKKLDSVLDSIDQFNLQRNFIDGFTIQVYSGSKLQDALNAKKDLSSYIPELESDIQYSQPNYRVKVGKYFNRIEAQKDYLIVKKYFSTAIIIPDKVSIN